MFKSYIWSLPTRVFHWLLATFILVAFLTAEKETITYHAFIGYAVLILLMFRFVWGYLGPRYSKFKDFSFSKQTILHYFKDTLKNKEETYTGHNPLASVVMFGMLGLLVIIILSGTLAYGVEGGKGVLSFLYSDTLKSMKIFKGIHEFLVHFLLLLIALHLGGVAIDKIKHSKHKTLESMFNGYKFTQNEEDGIKLTIVQKVIALLFLFLLIAFVVYTIANFDNPLLK